MNIKDIIYLPQNDRKALLVIILVMTVSIALVFIIGNSHTETAQKVNDSIQQTSLVKQATEAHPVYYHEETQVKEAFPFDPNTADSVQLKRLGLKPWQVRSILKYRAKGGVYSRPTDFARVYGMTKKQYEALAPFIRIADDFRPASDFYATNRMASNSVTGNRIIDTSLSARDNGKVYSYPQKLKAGEHVGVNTADTTALMKIPGIGRYYAKSIIRYREQLGGYVKKEQLLEIEGFPETALSFISIDNIPIKKINVNKLSVNQLRKHPYLNFYQAKEIFDYCRKQGPLKNLQELKLLQDFPPDEIERLEPYVTF